MTRILKSSIKSIEDFAVISGADPKVHLTKESIHQD